MNMALLSCLAVQLYCLRLSASPAHFETGPYMARNTGSFLAAREIMVYIIYTIKQKG